MILLPGLYLALLAFLLDRALRRWWDPVPARMWGVFGLVLVILFGQALFLGKVLLPVDILPGVAQPEDARKPPEGNVLQNDLVTQMVRLQAQVRRARTSVISSGCSVEPIQSWIAETACSAILSSGKWR